MLSRKCFVKTPNKALQPLSLVVMRYEHGRHE